MRLPDIQFDAGLLLVLSGELRLARGVELARRIVGDIGDRVGRIAMQIFDGDQAYRRRDRGNCKKLSLACSIFVAPPSYSD